ncbi:MAG TPA: S8 family serine peptidase [Candidatus Tumulicola sp.]|nr:S8 family serine peptidase [Candidatus Tumulicola sp.]
MGSGALPAAPGAPVQQSTAEQSGVPAENPAGEAPEAAQSPQVQASFPGDGEIPLASANAVHRVCPQARAPGEKECMALERVDLRASDTRPDAGHQGYGPSDLQSAYSIAGGKSSLVAIVDAYGYPRASADLAAYRSYYKLPACTTANGCLKIRNQTGGTNLPHPDPNWDQEQALDLDMVSAMCPRCKILLVQANSNSGNDLYTAVSEAAKLGAVVISNSYGGSEYKGCGGPGEPSDPAFSAPGHIYVASAGDYGGGLGDCGGPQQPCSLSTVVCVAGTHLVRAHDARGWKESAWNDLANYGCGGSCGGTGSGCSIVVKKPSWQNDGSCRMRSEADVSAEASVIAPVAVYYSGWTAFGGTSVSAPLVAGIYGRAGNGHNGNGPHNLWANRSHLHDQTVGNNLYSPITGGCASSVHYICYAAKGYDGPTGLGTPDGLAAF